MVQNKTLVREMQVSQIDKFGVNGQISHSIFQKW